MGFLDGGLGAVTGLVGGVLSMASARQAEKRQHKYNIDLQRRQAEYNEAFAENNQARAKEMWNYTNFPNQMKAIKEAGLSPGLIYGQGGAGGSTAGAGTAGPVGGAIGGEVTAGAAGGNITNGMGMNLANIISDIKLKEAQANKLNTDSDKTKGVDTKLAEAQIKTQEALANEAWSSAALNETKGWESQQQAMLYQKQFEALQVEINKMNVELDILKNDKEISDATKEEKIQMAINQNAQMVAIAYAMMMKGAKDDKERSQMEDYLKIAKENIQNAKDANEIKKEFNKIYEDLGDKQITQGYWNLAVNGLIGAANAASNFIPTTKVVKTITEGINQVMGKNGKPVTLNSSTTTTTTTTN